MSDPKFQKVPGGNFILDKDPEPTTEDILREQLEKRSARIAELEGRSARPARWYRETAESFMRENSELDEAEVLEKLARLLEHIGGAS